MLRLINEIDAQFVGHPPAWRHATRKATH